MIDQPTPRIEHPFEPCPDVDSAGSCACGLLIGGNTSVGGAYCHYWHDGEGFCGQPKSAHAEATVKQPGPWIVEPRPVPPAPQDAVPSREKRAAEVLAKGKAK